MSTARDLFHTRYDFGETGRRVKDNDAGQFADVSGLLSVRDKTNVVLAVLSDLPVCPRTLFEDRSDTQLSELKS